MRLLLLTLALLLVLPLAAHATARATVTWNDCTGEDGYKVERKDGAAAFVEVGAVAADVLSFVQAGLAEGVAYSYRVVCFNSFDPVGITSPATSAFAPGSPVAPAWQIGVTFTKE